MANLIALAGLPAPTAFETIGDQATLAQRWLRWKEEFELYCNASGAVNVTQKRALLLHLSGHAVREIVSTYAEDIRGKADEYDKTVQCLDDHFKEKKNVPRARQTFIELKPNPNESISNYVTRLKKTAEHCQYGDEMNNQIRDKVIQYITDDNLRSKLFRTENLTLESLLTVCGEYQNQEALTLRSQSTSVNMVSTINQSTIKCYRCNALGHIGRNCRRSHDHTCSKCNHKGHFEICCRTKMSTEGASRGRGFRGRPADSPRGTAPARGRGQAQSRGRGRGASYSTRGSKRVHYVEEADPSKPPNMTGDPEQVPKNFYVFNLNSDNVKSDTELLVLETGQKISVIIDSGSDCNLMSLKTFENVNKQNTLEISDCEQNVYAYGSKTPLEKAGRCELTCKMRETGVERNMSFMIIPTDVPTLISRGDSMALGILKLGENVTCNVKSVKNDIMSNMKQVYPSVFTGLGKLRNYQLRLHIDQSVPPIAQP